MGNALGADPSADVSPYYNPALAPNASGQSLTASVALLSFDRQLQSLQFGTELGPTAGVALGLIHAGVSGIDGRDSDGRRTEELSTDEYGLFLAFGNRFAERLSVGASLKLYQADYLDEVSPVLTFGLDLGATVDVTERATVGVVVSDLLAKYEWNTSSAGGRQNTDRFPVRVRLTGSYGFLEDGKLRVSGEVESRFTSRERRTRQPATSGGAPTTRLETEAVRLHDARARIGVAYPLADILSVRAGVEGVGAGRLRPSAGFGLREKLGELDVEAGYAAVTEPYVNDILHFITLRVFL